MRRLLPSVLLAALLSACAGPGGLFGPTDSAPAFRDQRMTVQSAGAAVTSGRSTKAEVAAALGPATVIAFDSGYEVWLWRVQEAGLRGRTEFVVLFTPAGLAAKTRVRRPPAAG